MPLQSGDIAPIDFTSVTAVSLESFAILPALCWYKATISDAKYTPASVNSEGKSLNANISWNLTVIEAPEAELSGVDLDDLIGKRIRDTFWYGSKGDFGMGRFLDAITHVMGKQPVSKDGAPYKGNMPLTGYNGRECWIFVNDNEWNGRVSTQVQRYFNVADETAKVEREIAAKAKLAKRNNGTAPTAPSQTRLPAAIAVDPESADSPFD